MQPDLVDKITLAGLPRVLAEHGRRFSHETETERIGADLYAIAAFAIEWAEASARQGIQTSNLLDLAQHVRQLHDHVQALAATNPDNA